MLIYTNMFATNMAKRDTFFIRATVTPSDTETFVQTDIDLGAYVDALGKSTLLIRSIEGEWTQGPNGAIPNGSPYMDGTSGGEALWQLTTQSQLGLVPLSNRSVIGKGQIWARNPDGSSNAPSQVFQDSHMPQHFSEGYIVAVDTIYLGSYGDGAWANSSELTFNIVLECEVMKMTEAAAMALALSQQ